MPEWPVRGRRAGAVERPPSLYQRWQLPAVVVPVLPPSKYLFGLPAPYNLRRPSPATRLVPAAAPFWSLQDRAMVYSCCKIVCFIHSCCLGDFISLALADAFQSALLEWACARQPTLG